MFRILTGIAALLLSEQAVAGESPRTCPVQGEVIHWTADYCMLKLETDDEIAAGECIGEQSKATFPGECAAKMHFKRAMCGLVTAKDASRGTIEQCARDPAFMGRTVRNGGVGSRLPGATAACPVPLDPRVANSCVVNARTLWRGARPDPAAASALVEMGVKTVVNLEWLLDDRKSFEKARVAAGHDQEIQYFRVRDWEPLAVMAPGKLDDHVAHFIAITRTQPKPIFVHCRSGQNRTGVMVAAYRVFNGADVETTIAEMEKYGGIWFKQDAQYVRTLTVQRRAQLEGLIEEWIPKLRRDARILCSNTKCTANAD